MGGPKRNFAEGIVRKLRRADELTAAGKSPEEIAAELELSPATLYQLAPRVQPDGHRRSEGTKELREENSKLKRLLAEAELDMDTLREVAKGKSEPSCQAPRFRHARLHGERVEAVGM